jgi:uncharacterized protein with HEPN domain
MSPDREYLRHILESARRILQYVDGMTEERFLETQQTQDAVLYRLSVIGEAAKWVPEDLRREPPSIEWRRMVGMRNFVIHEYWSTDLDLTWKTVHEKLPPLIAAIETHLSS